MMCSRDDRVSGDLRLIRVIAKLRVRQLRSAREGRIEESARYAGRVRRLSRMG